MPKVSVLDSCRERERVMEGFRSFYVFFIISIARFIVRCLRGCVNVISKIAPLVAFLRRICAEFAPQPALFRRNLRRNSGVNGAICAVNRRNLRRNSGESDVINMEKKARSGYGDAASVGSNNTCGLLS